MAKDTDKKDALELPFNIHGDVVSRYALGGALTGAGLAAALNFAQMIRSLNQQRKQRIAGEETGEGTIVLTLPKEANDPAGIADSIDLSELGTNLPGTLPEPPDTLAEGELPEEELGTPPAPEGGFKPTFKGAAANEEAGTTYEEIPVAPKGDVPADDAERGAVNPRKMTSGEVDAIKVKMLRRIMESAKRQLRYPDGQYGMGTMKTANWQTLAASLLAAGGGGALGYKLIDKLYEIKLLKGKEEELDEAKTEYLDELAKSSTYMSDPPTKQAALWDEERRTFRTLDYPLAAGILTLLLGSGATAYFTKRVLDELEEEQKTKLTPPRPKLQKIVFRSADKAAAAPDLEIAKEAQETFQAALGIFLDICEGIPKVVGNEKVAEALAEKELAPTHLYKAAVSDYDVLIATLQANPELRRVIQKAAFERHPFLKYLQWGVGLPGVGGALDRRLYSETERLLGPKSAAEKEAFLLPDIPAIVSSFYGSTAAERLADKEREEKVEATPSVEAAPAVDAGGKVVPPALKNLQIIADDPASKEWLEKNQAKLKKLLQQLAEHERL